MKKGCSTSKELSPSITDPRVQFVKGLFQNSLPEFLKSYILQARLIVHNGSHPCASTLYTLAKFDSSFTTGAVFDEFGSARMSSGNDGLPCHILDEGEAGRS